MIDLQGANALKEAENCGLALEKEAQYRARGTEVGWPCCVVLSRGGVLAIALRELGQNAGKLGNLTITSEMLASLLNHTPTNSGELSRDGPCLREDCGRDSEDRSGGVI